MAIDDPLEQARFLVRSDEAQSAPFSKVAKRVLSFPLGAGKILKALGTGDIRETISAFAEALKHFSDLKGDDHAEYLLSVLIPEVKTLWSRFDGLDQKHREFLETDWPALVADGLHKARIVRAKERVLRIAAILTSAARAEPVPAADDVEELMRIAMDLSDRDIVPLRELVRHSPLPYSLPHMRHSMRLIRGRGVRAWNSIQWLELGFSEHEVESTCAKLQSFGLIARLDLIPSLDTSTFSVPLNPYELLQKGMDFFEYIRSAAEGQTEL